MKRISFCLAQARRRRVTRCARNPKPIPLARRSCSIIRGRRIGGPDSAFPSKPSGNLNGGVGPVWMERVESYVTFRPSATQFIIYPLDGSGSRLNPLANADVEHVVDGFRIHLQAPIRISRHGMNSSPTAEVYQRNSSERRRDQPQETP